MLSAKSYYIASKLYNPDYIAIEPCKPYYITAEALSLI